MQKFTPPPTIYNYLIDVRYKREYFHDPKAPLTHRLHVQSIRPKTKEQIQTLYNNCKVIKIVDSWQEDNKTTDQN